MSPELTVEIFRHVLYIALIMSSILIIPGLIIGLAVASFQAATQINEMSLVFVPKLIVTIVVLMLASPWLLSVILNYTQSLITNIPAMLG